MKKMLSMLLAGAMLVSITGCSGQRGSGDGKVTLKIGMPNGSGDDSDFDPGMI